MPLVPNPEYLKWLNDIKLLQSGSYRQTEAFLVDLTQSYVDQVFPLRGNQLQLVMHLDNGSGTRITDPNGILHIRFNHPDAPPLRFSPVAAGYVTGFFGPYYQVFITNIAIRPAGSFMCFVNCLGAGITFAQAASSPGSGVGGFGV